MTDTDRVSANPSERSVLRHRRTCDNDRPVSAATSPAVAPAARVRNTARILRCPDPTPASGPGVPTPGAAANSAARRREPAARPVDSTTLRMLRCVLSLTAALSASLTAASTQADSGALDPCRVVPVMTVKSLRQLPQRHPRRRRDTAPLRHLGHCAPSGQRAAVIVCNADASTLSAQFTVAGTIPRAYHRGGHTSENSHPEAVGRMLATQWPLAARSPCLRQTPLPPATQRELCVSQARDWLVPCRVHRGSG